MSEPMSKDEAYRTYHNADAEDLDPHHAVAVEQRRRDQAEIERLRAALAEALDGWAFDALARGVDVYEARMKQIGELRKLTVGT